MEIVLYQPEIPSNTGNIARTCAVTGCPLHLIEPLGYSLEDRYLKRAGLDYWDQLDIRIWKDWDSFMEVHGKGRFWYLTTKGTVSYGQVDFGPSDYLVFGPETRGLPGELLEEHPESTCRIPMGDKFRSLNLSNAVAIVLYEALRQNHYPGLR